MGKQVGQAGGGVGSDCGGKYCITKDNYKNYQFGTAENVGKLIQEINIRWAGFGGNVPTTEFDNRTENTIKQFQRDYMNITPTGKICSSLLNAIDEFCKKYPIKEGLAKCPCGSCNGFGNSKYSEQKGQKNILEKSRKYEYPGIHRSVIAGARAILFYIDKDLKNEYSFDRIYSGYRCHVRNSQTGRGSTNHMGKALDLHFKYKGVTISGTADSSLRHMNTIKERYILDKMNPHPTFAPSNINKFALEPTGTASDHAWSWIHIDVRGYEVKYLADSFFVKTAEEWNNSSLNSLAKQMGLACICSCGGQNDIVSSSLTNESTCSHCKIFEKTANPIKREAYYREVGSIMINYMASLNVTNKFKGLYMLAQRRTENGFELNTPLNNPMNLKMQGDLGRTDLMTKETEKNASGVEVTISKNQSFASFSTEKVGFDTYIRQLKKNWENSYKALIDEDKTIENFSYPLQYEGRIGVYGTGIPKYGLDAVATYKREVEDNFKNILSNYKAWYECMLTCPNHKDDKEEIKRDLILLNRLK